jgi:anthranilate synthase component 2
MYVLIDNYDSFTYNLFHYLGELGARLAVHRNDQVTVEEALAETPQGLIISPGPCDPDRAGICLELIAAASEREIPILGVCLGHQAIGQAFGGKIIRVDPMHGKVSKISHRGIGVFEGLPQPLTGTRYHSLVVERESLPDCLQITAESENGLVMGLQHKELPVHGVQFHPESIASESGHALLANFLRLTGLNVHKAA